MAKAKKRRSQKMDPKLVAIKEANYIANKYDVPLRVVKSVMRTEGRSRKKIYAKLREMDYEIKTKRFVKG